MFDEQPDGDLHRECAAEIHRLEAELAACAGTLPGPIYMDPPDGGDVPVSEQLKRMAKDAELYRWIRENAVWRPSLSPGVVTWNLHMPTPDIRAGKLAEDSVARKLDAAIAAAVRKKIKICSCIECIGDQLEPTAEQLAEYELELAAANEAYKKPPCQRCGAMTAEEAETKCRSGCGDDDHCHGTDLWPD